MTTPHTSGASDLPEAMDAIADSQYLAGVTAGWNAAQANDPNAALRKIHESRAGYLKPLRDAQLAALAAGRAVAPADRTPQDFAIEFAEYMAKGAEALITAINADADVRLRIAESDDVSDDDEHDAEATVSEMQRALQSDIYEFRKRRDRAASAPATRPAPPAMDGGEDSALLDFIERHPEMSLRQRKGKWAFVGFTNYEYDVFPELRLAIRAARAAQKDGGPT